MFIKISKNLIPIIDYFDNSKQYKIADQIENVLIKIAAGNIATGPDSLAKTYFNAPSERLNMNPNDLISAYQLKHNIGDYGNKLNPTYFYSNEDLSLPAPPKISARMTPEEKWNAYSAYINNPQFRKVIRILRTGNFPQGNTPFGAWMQSVAKNIGATFNNTDIYKDPESSAVIYKNFDNFYNGVVKLSQNK